MKRVLYKSKMKSLKVTEAFIYPNSMTQAAFLCSNYSKDGKVFYAEQIEHIVIIRRIR